jgi:hypothetical protein
MTVPDSIEWLSTHKDAVQLYSLDNDLLVDNYIGDPGEGWQLCEWICANAPKKPIIAHTTNSNAAIKMEMACKDSGWEYHRIVPYNGNEWIDGVWIRIVSQLLR